MELSFYKMLIINELFKIERQKIRNPQSKIQNRIMFFSKNPWGLTPKEQFIEMLGNVIIGGLLVGCYLKVLFL